MQLKNLEEKQVEIREHEQKNETKNNKKKQQNQKLPF